MHIKAIIKDEDLLTQNVKDKLIFTIFWQHNEISYPSKDWEDFGCVVIGWWVSTVIQFLAGENEGEFSFMDGPYSISAKYNQDSEALVLFPEQTNSVWEIQLRIIINALISTVNYIYKKFSDNNVHEEDLLIFKQYLEALEDCLLQLKK